MKITLLGTGLMGTPMAERLLSFKHEVHVYNRTPQKSKALEAKGAKVFLSPREAVEGTECVILMLGDGRAVRDVLFNDPQIDLKGRTVVQMGTIASHESMAFKEEVAKRSGQYFECPVLGSRAEALAGELILIVGSSKAQFEQWEPFLKVFGPQPCHVGDVGKAAVVKLALNQLIASLATTFSLSVGLLQKEGVDIEMFMKLLRKSALYAPMFDKKLPRMLARNFSNPNFPVMHLIKDVELFLNEQQATTLGKDHLTGVLKILKQAQSRNLGGLDYSALFDIIAPE